MGWINIGEARRLETGSQWELTIEDLCDLMNNYKSAPTVGKQQEYATRAISLVMGNLERRGIIDDQFLDIREPAYNKQSKEEL